MATIYLKENTPFHYVRDNLLSVSWHNTSCFNIFCSDTSAVLTLYILIMLQTGV